MISEALQNFIAEEELSIVQAMTKIDKNAHGILFVVRDEILVGSLTDGDIRRWLIKTGELDSTIANAMNRIPKKIDNLANINAFEYMREQSINAVPVVDAQNRIVDIIFASDYKKETIVASNALADVSVIVMAGGKGTRLYPYTKILPKPLIPIGDIPIVERILDRFCDYGVKKYHMTVNYKKGMIKSYFSELNPSYTINYVEEEKPLGTAGSIKLIEEKFECPVFVTNCDSLIQADYEKLYQFHKNSGNAMTIVSALKNITVPYGVITSAENGVITSMEEKPKLSYFINTGMYVINPEVIELIPSDTFFHMTDLADILMKKGQQIGMYPISEDSFLDMGEFEEMSRMEQILNIK